MKKTLVTIATLALAAASSQADLLSTLTFETNGANYRNAVVNTDSSYGLVARTTLNYVSDYNVAYVNLIDDNKVPTNIIVPELTVCGQEASGHNLVVSTILTNTSDQSIRITGTELSLIGVDPDYNPATGLNGTRGFNSVGQFTEGRYNRIANVFSTLTGGNYYELRQQLFNLSSVASADPNAGTWEGVHTGSFDFSDADIILEAGKSLQLNTLIRNYVEDLRTPALYVGMKEYRVYGEVLPVPEPATASLSLLGLAALMMRRRRA